MTQIKLEARVRIAAILAAAITVAKAKGYTHITRKDIAEHAGIPETLVSYHCGTMDSLRRDVMREAIRTECLPVLAQGLVARDRHAAKAPDELKKKALAHFA